MVSPLIDMSHFPDSSIDGVTNEELIDIANMVDVIMAQFIKNSSCNDLLYHSLIISIVEYRLLSCAYYIVLFNLLS